MRRWSLHISDDIERDEAIHMAATAGFFLRKVEGVWYMDRVPGIIRKDPPANVVNLKREKR